MTLLAPGTRAFLSWARQGLAGQLLATGAAATEGGRLQLPVQLQLASGASAAALMSNEVKLIRFC